MTVEHYPTIIIGSGFGGTVTAVRLTEAGEKVCVLERGPWRDTRANREAGGENLVPLPQGRHFFSKVARSMSAPALPRCGVRLNKNGLFDIHYQREYTAVCTSGVGGGSHVYTALHSKPANPAYWDQAHPELSDADMAQHYDWMMQRMHTQLPPADAEIPNYLRDDTGRPEWMTTEGVPEISVGYRFDQGYNNNCVFFGDPESKKYTLDEHMLRPAMDKGLVVKDRHQVLDVARQSAGFRLTVRDHYSGKTGILTADRVIMAAGTLNTLRLLFASRARGSLQGMPALGLGIGGNCDMIAYWPINDKGRDYSVGLPCHGRFRIDDKGPRPLIISVGVNGIDAVPLLGPLRKRLKRDLLIVGMEGDNANGMAIWRKGRLRFSYSQDMSPGFARTREAFARMHKLSGHKVYEAPGKWNVTVHPLGGARVDPDPAKGVVNATGEVHDIPGLHVADATALPAATGGGPTMTISAWASHVATALIARETGHGGLPQAPTAADTSAEPVAHLARA